MLPKRDEWGSLPEAFPPQTRRERPRETEPNTIQKASKDEPIEDVGKTSEDQRSGNQNKDQSRGQPEAPKGRTDLAPKRPKDEPIEDVGKTNENRRHGAQKTRTEDNLRTIPTPKMDIFTRWTSLQKPMGVGHINYHMPKIGFARLDPPPRTSSCVWIESENF